MRNTLIKPSLGNNISVSKLEESYMESFQDDERWNHPDCRHNQATFKPNLITAKQLCEATKKENKSFYNSRLFHNAYSIENKYSKPNKLMVYARFNYVLRKASI